MTPEKTQSAPTAQTMTARQRMMAAVLNGKPDRVPVAPDMSVMMPTRLTGKDFHAVHIDNDPPIWQAYINALKHFGFDGWFIYGAVGMTTKDVTHDVAWEELPEDRRLQTITIHTPEGDLTHQHVFYHDNPPTPVKKPIADLERDWPRYKYLLGEIVDVDDRLVAEQRAALGELGIYGICQGAPGFHTWNEIFDGGIMTVSQIMMYHPEILDELRELQHERCMRELDHLMKARPDFILTGGSGSITLASPQLWRQYSLPTVQEVCRRCKQNNIPTMVHSCGKSRYLIETLSRESDLNCINPIEVPPMGDCTLKEAKEIVRGTGLSLMGNLHTTEVMLSGTAEQVAAASRQAIDDAAEGGGFILSTGDQCGRDTPEENIFAMVETAKTYGRYD